ncbi:MAG TPA: polyprenyl synthetase family protein [Candidatus Tumulicola sp.]|nr:polyprenyl synthetase family protein [Candidatus Tumulicola sp.]
MTDPTNGAYGGRAADADLHDVVEGFFRTSFSTDNPLITEAVKRMLAAGGKRLRPRVTLLAAGACGARTTEHLHLAAYMELIHVATLIHDDVVDNARTRRGVNATAVDYGNRVSVLAGDYLFAWIFKNVTAGYPHPIPNVLSATLADICDGEVLQLRALGDLALSPDAYVEIARKKTASLFAASAQCGAIVGGGSPREIGALREFGDAFGIAFQMRDDLLDMTADERSLGKPVGNDLTERKMTIPLIAALAAGDGNFHDQVRSFYDGGQHDAIPAIVRGIERQGGLSATRAHIAAYVERAKGALEPIAPGTAKEELAKLAGDLLAG